ncbi:MAG: SET domain-containing protein-lysine N-methyltransferase [Gammaproteobacteria bacterium]|nr:SET domain-containing protein-lysine N-methyltransferase [Gammaproteobacteria bacterium]
MTKNEELKKLFYVEKSTIHGKGLFARIEIKEGTYLGTYHGPVVDENGMHVLWVEHEEGVWQGRDGKNMLRYLNHSDAPCAEFDGFELYAIADIKPDQEVTFDYGEDPAA